MACPATICLPHCYQLVRTSLILTRLFAIAGPISKLWEAYGKIERDFGRVSNHFSHTGLNSLDARSSAKRRSWRCLAYETSQNDPATHAGRGKAALAQLIDLLILYTGFFPKILVGLVAENWRGLAFEIFAAALSENLGVL